MNEYITTDKQRINNSQENIEIRSEEVQEIMGAISPWILRWGITVLFSVLITGMLLAWFIRYPEVLLAQVVITTSPPPIRLAAPTTGKLAHLFVEEGQPVMAGDWLIVIESAAAWGDILKLEQLLKGASTGNLLGLMSLPELQLGSLQDRYSQLRKNMQDWQFFKSSHSYHEANLHSLQQQFDELLELTHNFKEQLDLRQRELNIAENQLKISRQLYEDQAISRTDLESVEIDLIQKRLAAKQLNAQINNNNVQIAQYSQQKGSLQQKSREEAIKLKILTSESFQQLLAALEVWKQQYLIRAPETGHVAYFDIWAPNQQVNAGDPIISLLPHTTQFIGKATLQMKGSGKIRVGQEVNIKLDNFNYQRYGVVLARVRHISPLPKQDNYLLDLELRKGLVTTYNEKLSLRAELHGQAEIITEELRLLERVFYEFRSLLDN